MALRQWSTTASGNANVAGINWQEGQPPSTVNNSAREEMSQVRGQYTPGQWHWVEVSNTASVASQTSFKLSTNLTADFHAGRRVRLTGGSSARYASVVSSSYTAETVVTISVDSGSLSASHTIAALGPAVTNTPIGGYVPANQTATFTSPVIVAGPISITSATLSAAGATRLGGTLGVSATASFTGPVAMANNLTVTGQIVATNGTQSITVNGNDGGIEMQRTGGGIGAYIDFKDVTGDDFDVRIQQNGTNAALDISPSGTGVTARINSTGVRSITTAKAWLRGTYSGGTPVADQAYNVSSLGDLGLGTVQMNFSANMSGTNYCAIGSSQYVGAGYVLAPVTCNATNLIFTTIHNATDGGTDVPFNVAIFDGTV